jgi:hypothetical protein
MNRLIGEIEEVLSERGATLLNGAITVAPNDYGTVSATVKIDLTGPEEAPF